MGAYTFLVVGVVDTVAAHVFVVEGVGKWQRWGTFSQDLPIFRRRRQRPPPPILVDAAAVVVIEDFIQVANLCSSNSSISAVGDL